MNDRDLRKSLQALRAADEAEAPSMNAVIGRSPRRVVVDARRLALAAVVVVALGGSITLVAREALRPPRLVVPDEIVALTAWRPMTDVLLEKSPALPSLLPPLRLELPQEIP